MLRYVKHSPITASVSGPVEPDTVYELALYIENDGNLYRQMIVPTIKNMQRKIKSGKYDDSQAVKAWQYVADEGVRRYGKEFGNGGNSVAWVNKNTRIAIAEELKDYYDDLVQDPDSISSATKIEKKTVSASTKKYRAKGKKSVEAASVIQNGLSEYKPWSGAKDTWEILEKFGKLDELENYIDERFYDESRGEGVIGETELNDLLWFEPEHIYEYVGLYYNPDTDEVSDEPFDEDEDEYDDEDYE